MASPQNARVEMMADLPFLSAKCVGAYSIIYILLSLEGSARRLVIVVDDAKL